jgi:hypothetical protein
MAGPKNIKLTVGGRTYYFTFCKVWREMQKNLVIFKLAKQNKGRDLLRVEDRFHVSGMWFDDDDANDYDGLTAFVRYKNFMSQAKYGLSTMNIGPTCLFTWGDYSYRVKIENPTFSKMSGEGDRIEYDLSLIKVTK